jgi:hypothetical protein
MSLIVCGSAQEEYSARAGRDGVITGGTGIERPNKFQNHLVSPLKIKPNSQIAVQSCKIEKGALFEITDTDVFYIYFGRELTDNDHLNDFGSTPIPIKLPRGSYDAQTLCDMIEQTMNNSYMNPEIWNNMACAAELNSASGTMACVQFQINQRGSTASENSNLTILTGVKADEWTDWLPKAELYWDDLFNATWQTRFSDMTGVGSGGYAIGAKAQKAFTDFAGGTAYSASAISFSRTEAQMTPAENGGDEMWDYDCVGIMGNDANVPPLGLCDGVMDVDFRYVGVFSGTENESQVTAHPWRIGLTRPTVFVPGVGGHNNGWACDDGVATRFGNGGDGSFWDYMVECDGEKINVYHWAMDGDLETDQERQRSWKGQPVIYNGEPILVSKLNTSGAGNYCILRFQTFGDHIKAYLMDSNACTTTALAIIDQATHSTDQDHNFKPINDNTGALYLKTQLWYDGHYDGLYVTNWRCHTALQDNYNYPKVTAEPNAAGLYTIDPGNSFWPNAFWSKGSTQRAKPTMINNWADSLAGTGTPNPGSRLIGFTDGDKIPPILNRVNARVMPDLSKGQMIKSSTPVVFSGLNGSSGINWGSVILLGRDGGPNRVDIGNYTSKMVIGQYPNMSVKLGYKLRPVLVSTYDISDTLDNTVTYQSSEDLIPSGKEAFVRFSGGTQTSYNANKGSVSKIIYPIPRFDNSGRAYGQLFFECNEKTYIDFNNTDTLVLNDIQVEIVDINERPVNDLTGNTIVTFHIKQK